VAVHEVDFERIESGLKSLKGSVVLAKNGSGLAHEFKVRWRVNRVNVTAVIAGKVTEAFFSRTKNPERGRNNLAAAGHKFGLL
jgi:hypothetical protein